MISKRELDEIKRQMEGLTYFSIRTEDLSKLIEVYEQVMNKKRVLPLPEPPKTRNTDD